MVNPGFWVAVAPNPLTSRLKISHGWLRRWHETTSKSGKNRPRGAGPAKGWNVKVNLGYFFVWFLLDFLPAAGDHSFARNNAVLRQMTCFGGEWFS